MDIIYFRSFLPEYGEACSRKKVNYRVLVYKTHILIFGDVKQQLYDHLPLISQTVHALTGHC